MGIATKVVITDAAGNLFYRQEHEWMAATPGIQAAIAKGLEKQTKFLEDLKTKQNKTPDAIYSAVVSCTGIPGLTDLVYDAFTFDMYQKAHHSWNQVCDEILREQEKHIPKP
jgi:hypothetical protein